MPSVVARNLAPRVLEHLGTFRLVVLGGARQTGKTTLITEILDLAANYTFDDRAVRDAALQDPLGFVRALPRPAAIDEFQRAGEPFLLAVKQVVDRDRTRGRLLLTGSANYLAASSTSETLAGRTGRLVLWPLSLGERHGVRETFLDLLFEPGAWPPPSLRSPSRAEIGELILGGAYPEIVTEGIRGRGRRDWFQAYVAAVVSREALRPMADVRMEHELRRVLRLLAARSSQELVISSLAADAELNRETVRSYVALLEALYLVHLLPAWSTNLTTRAKHRPKIHLVDTGLTADLCGLGERDLSPTQAGSAAGALFESLVVTELLKQASWSERAIDLTHFRDRHGAEIDVIAEDRRTGQIAAIEIKATESPTTHHAKHLRWLRERLGKRFAGGFLIHAGSQALPLGPQIWSLPLAALWRSDR